ncbi:MAG: hypothetical protein JOY93_11785 [Acidobacteriales bacterium]|nr:hypothetical protein [Terriglobales bacterium]
MSTLPSREVLESLALPEQSTKAPRGICLDKKQGAAGIGAQMADRIEWFQGVG